MLKVVALLALPLLIWTWISLMSTIIYHKPFLECLNAHKLDCSDGSLYLPPNQ